LKGNGRVKLGQVTEGGGKRKMGRRSKKKNVEEGDSRTGGGKAKGTMTDVGGKTQEGNVGNRKVGQKVPTGTP